MKAWIVENTRDYDYFDWNEIIFAENYKKARKLALQTELYETSEDFVHMRVRRYPDMDDTENLNRKEFECANGKTEFAIVTLEDFLTVSLGDFIVCGVDGECYPCKPNTFLKTYEKV